LNRASITSLARRKHYGERCSASRHLIITPHSAFHSPHAWDDIRRKSAETMRAALIGPRPQNVIAPDMF
jgi:hypothetical protein